MPYIQNAATLIIETVLGVYLFFVILRFLFQLLRVDFHNPISQMLVTLTNPPLKILRQFIPGLFGIDLASIVLMLLIASLKVYLLVTLSGFSPNIAGVVVIGIGEIVNSIIWIFLGAILISVVLSWVAPSSRHPAIAVVEGISRPALAPFRRLIPSFGGLDFTPIIALLILNLLQQLLVAPIMDVGRALIL